MRFFQVDVFAEGPFRGNPLAVFPEASDLDRAQMQTIATEMNLSETAFVTAHSNDSYSVRIFTPRTELPFAGHPTIGTAWLLTRLGLLDAADIHQQSPAGVTEVTLQDDRAWFLRTGTVSDDLLRKDRMVNEKLASALGLTTADIGLEPRELGRSTDRLEAAHTDIGIQQLMVPVKDVAALGRCSPVPALLLDIDPFGVYCFTARGAGRLQARGFFPGGGIDEDPATGSAAAGLGVYLTDRLGPIEAEIAQGVEMGRPSRIYMRADTDSVRVGGRCELIFEATLATVP